MPRVAHFLALAFSLLLLGCHVAWRAEPWDSSLGGVNSGAYYGYACRGLEAHGFFAKRMQGPEFFHPEDPDIWRPYANHPGTGYFLIYPCYRYLGRDEAALRWAMLIACAALLLVFRRALGRVVAPITASAATMTMAALPLLFQYGNMVDIPIFCLLLATPTLVAWRGWREGRGRYAAYFALAFLAGLTDWFAYFLVPGIWLIDLLEAGRARERLRRAFLIGLPFGAALIVVGAWIVWAQGGLGVFVEHVGKLGRAFSGELMQQQSDIHRALAGETPPFLASLARHLLRTVGIPLLALASLGLLRALAGRLREPAMKIAVAGLVAGVLPAFAFQTHAAKHEFWFMMASGSFALLATGALLGFGREESGGPRLRAAGLVLLLGAASFSAWRGIELHDSYRTTALRDRGLAMAERFGPRDFVMTSLGFAADRFYVDAVMVPGVRTRRAYDDLRQALRPHARSFDRVFVVWDMAETADFLWLRGLPLLDRRVPTPVALGQGSFVILELDAAAFFAD